MVEWEVPPSRRVAFIGVLVVAAAAIATSWSGHFRVGGYLLALAMALAATLRALLPERYCLGLLVRGRTFDVITAATFSAAIAFTVTIVPG